MKRLRERVESRLTGVTEKRQICRVQLWSSWLFFPAGVILFFIHAPAFALMFVTEALGQFLMARDNQRTLAEGDARFRYLPATALGRAATTVFAITAFSRFLIAYDYLDSGWILIAGGLLSSSMILAGFLSQKPEETGGFVLTISAFFLAVVSFQHHDLLTASVQFLYGTLLVTGVLAMRASRAEVINIFLWLALFLGFFASPQT